MSLAMSPERRILMKFCILLSFVLAIQCGRKEPNVWKGSIEEYEGVAVVKNPSIPIFNEDIVELQEDFNIKESDASAGYVFNKPSSLLLDEKHNLYVLDPAEANIKVFNAQGHFLRIIGKKGDGPGELDTPTSADISRNEIAVYSAQNRRLTFFDTDGQYKRMFSAGTSLINMQLDSRGNIFALPLLNRDGQRKYELQKFDSSLNYLKTVVSSNLFPAWCCFTAGASFAITKEDLIVYGQPDKYELKIFNNDGKLVRTIQKDYYPIRIPGEEIEFAFKNLPLSIPKSNVMWPEYYKPFYGFYVDEEGRIIVNTYDKLARVKERAFDIFSPEGKFLATIKLKYFSACLWANGRLYTIGEDEGGLPIVRVYRVIWKTDQLEL